MNLRNYTSKVPASRSLENIERLLVDAGATHIARFYDGEKKVVGVLFQINMGGKPVTFKLPSRPDRVLKEMEKGRRRMRSESQKRLGEQAQRTAWKILFDWVSVQVSMVLLEQAEAAEVFLPYVYDSVKDQTLFERVKESGYKLLTAGSSKSNG